VYLIAWLLILVGAQEMLDRLSIIIDPFPFVIEAFITLGHPDILAIILVVVVLQGDDAVLIEVHDVLHLGHREGQATLRSLLQSLQLRIEIDQLIRFVLHVVSLINLVRWRLV
jgi:hypothetical protein